MSHDECALVFAASEARACHELFFFVCTSAIFVTLGTVYDTVCDDVASSVFFARANVFLLVAGDAGRVFDAKYCTWALQNSECFYVKLVVLLKCS